MKKIGILFIFLNFLNVVTAQYKIEYDYVITNQLPGNVSIVRANTFLVTDGIYSRFVKNRVFNGVVDLKFENSMADLEESANKSNKYAKGDSLGYVIAKNFSKDSIYMRLLNDKSEYVKIPRRMVKFQYEVIEEYKSICNYKCQKALVNFENRQFEVWFTNEIPISDGPWVFQGLPGLILEIRSTDNLHLYVARTINKTKPLNNATIAFPYKKTIDLETYQKRYLEIEENKFKFNKAQGDPNVKFTVTINNLDIPRTFFE
jgi:GLPGLI family protein